MRGIIFDFNGTMLWDADFHELAWNAMARELRGYEMDAHELEQHMHGRTNKAITNYVLGREAAPDELRQIADRKEAHYREICLQHPERFRLAPRLATWLDWLAQRDVPRAIATSSEWPNVDFFVQHLHLGQWFAPEHVVYDDGSFRSKPHPDIFLLAAQRLGLPTERCVAIEDSYSGLVAGAAAGIGHLVAIAPSGRALDTSALGYPVQHIHQFDQLAWSELFA